MDGLTKREFMRRHENIGSLHRVPEGRLTTEAWDMARNLINDGCDVYAYKRPGVAEWNIWCEDTRYTTQEWNEYVRKLHEESSPEDVIRLAYVPIGRQVGE